MFKTWKTTVLAAAIMLGVSAPAAFAQKRADSPQRPPHGINAREARQVARIKEGKADGKLTKGELDRLRADEAALRAKEKVFRESGQGLNSAEYRALERNLDRLSKEIFRATHNGKEPGDGK